MNLPVPIARTPEPVSTASPFDAAARHDGVRHDGVRHGGVAQGGVAQGGVAQGGRRKAMDDINGSDARRLHGDIQTGGSCLPEAAVRRQRRRRACMTGRAGKGS